ncbi:MAG: DUF1127 domain-containing protein [Mangrovicoccus sp.]|nr:DUF1127 domain-containing protein [Mangrovicoccus sp.]
MAIIHDIRDFEPTLVERARSAFGHWRARRAAFQQVIDELSVLNDRELGELGLSRADIPAIARQAADAA